MTKTIAITESLLLNAIRSPGFLALNALGGLVLVSLSLTSGFSLGRELLMIRESAFGTLFVMPFACSILACSVNGGRKPAAWRSACALAAGGRLEQRIAFIAHAILAGVLSFLALTPFLVAGLCLFHAQNLMGVSAAVIGVVFLVATAAVPFMKRDFPARMFMFPVLAALCTFPLLRFVPEGLQLCSLWGFSVIPAAMAAAIAGASCTVLRGVAGPVLAMTAFLASNLRAAAGEDGIVHQISRLLPDLAGLNPSLLVSSGTAIGFREISGTALYALLIMLSAAAAAIGAASLREEPV